MAARKAALHLRKAPLHLRKAALHLRKAALHLRKAALHLRKAALHLRKAALHLRGAANTDVMASSGTSAPVDFVHSGGAPAGKPSAMWAPRGRAEEGWLGLVL